MPVRVLMDEPSGRKPTYLDKYLDYTTGTECPTLFHRWSGITTLAAYLGRQVNFKLGHFEIHPNLYTMIVGISGTRKSTAIKISNKVLKAAGYKTFAANKTRQEKFLVDLAEQAESLASLAERSSDAYQDILEKNLFGEELDEASNYEGKPPAECLIAADEFNNFIGVNNLDFISLLTELWDYEGVYGYKLKNAKSVYIPSPTLNVLGGNTPTGLAQAFPPETIGQGFFSRLLLVYAEPTGVKYTIPPQPSEELKQELVADLHKIKDTVKGEMTITEEGMTLLDKIYHTEVGPSDFRFEAYTTRRLTHLIKLAMVIAASRISLVMTHADILEANTILSYTEQFMPKALGEFGRAKNSVATHKLMELINNSFSPVTVQDAWIALHQDLDSRSQLNELINDLQVADKIQVIPADPANPSSKAGFLPKRSQVRTRVEGTVDWRFLTSKERENVHE